MLLGTIIQGRRYSFGEYGAASLLVLGIVLFTMGDVDTLPTFDPKGVVLITVALFLDSAAGNFEERRFFNIPNPVSHAEVVFHANLIGICFTTTIMLCSGELLPAINHAATHTNIMPSIYIGAFFGYLSVSFVLLLIRYYGATNTEVVKSLRKMISIAASLFLYPKPFGWKYAGGLGATTVGLAAMLSLKRRKMMLPGGSLEATK
uniref:Uncharacterized protein n=1 Tax=Mantoniella antarctica TaxID=81844 RepID=A0A7S0T047_9CHLO|mmetsp:Transcript_4277/g.10474  ORF Transcript_4277/g.10474 Transcript_4277/m.10474 type:complete len:205 (+) Transcript_4277:104-718(+)